MKKYGLDLKYFNHTATVSIHYVNLSEDEFKAFINKKGYTHHASLRRISTAKEEFAFSYHCDLSKRLPYRLMYTKPR